MVSVPYAGSQKAVSTISASAAKQLVLFVAVSGLLLVPCFWHAHIEAGDLGSHVYNAWLAELITQGRAPGLYIVTQFNNVLFDLLLLNFAKMFGLVVAEKLAVSLAVLLFFWGVFAFAKTVSSQSPWFITPCIAMLTYGLSFHTGFMNFYMSIGLCCIALSLLWDGRRNGLIAAVVIAPVILLAHPLGFALFFSVGAYRLLWRAIPKWNWLLPIFALALCGTASWFLAYHTKYEIQWREIPFWRLNGTNQFHVFGQHYRYVTRAAMILVLVATVIAAWQSSARWKFWKERRLALELYLVSFFAVGLLPENIHTDPTAGWIGEIASRLTLMIAVFGLCWLASLPPQHWHLAVFGALALVFFAFVYQDTAFLNRMETSADQVTHQLPFGTRALATIHTPPDYRARFMHIIDRACIGHCFLVSNYEPSTKQFRIRVQEGSPVVANSVDDSEDMQAGSYDVQDEDLPLKQIYQCSGRDLTQICIRELAADEKNGRIGYNPQIDTDDE
jgi:hypothetical protein